MAQCTGTTRTGDRCRRGARPGGERCTAHDTGDPRRCTAHNRHSNGQRCGRAAKPGTRVCRYHGAANPTVEAAAKRNLLRQDAAKVLRRLGGDVDPVRDPAHELAQLAGRLRAVELVLWSFMFRDGGDPDPQLVKVHGEAAEREARVLADMKRLGLEEDTARVEAQKAQLLATALQAILRDLSLSPRQRALAPGLIREHLLALPADGDADPATIELPVARAARERAEVDAATARDA